MKVWGKSSIRLIYLTLSLKTSLCIITYGGENLSEYLNDEKKPKDPLCVGTRRKYDSGLSVWGGLNSGDFPNSAERSSLCGCWLLLWMVYNTSPFLLSICPIGCCWWSPHAVASRREDEVSAEAYVIKNSAALQFVLSVQGRRMWPMLCACLPVLPSCKSIFLHQLSYW